MCTYSGPVTRLILLNGGPASGKSTLARRYVADHPLALCLDIDTVRSLLGAWSEHPHDAGLAARALAIAMAEVHLRALHEVIVPQFLGRPGFIDELAACAERSGVAFVEAVVEVDPRVAQARFLGRRDDVHAHSARLVDEGTFEPVAAMYDRLAELLAARPWTARVPVVDGDEDASYAALLHVLC